MKVLGIILIIILVIIGGVAIKNYIKNRPLVSVKQGESFSTTNTDYTKGLPVPIEGTDLSGTTYGQPAGWPRAAGPWNANGAHYNPATGKLVFETYRADIVAGSIAPGGGKIKATGVTDYFQAGPKTGTISQDGTTVLYVTNADGSDPVCFGCEDVTDGVNGVKIFGVTPSTSGSAGTPTEKIDFTIYANQNKDLASWYPDGSWIIASIEMPTHALTHNFGNAEIGMFNNLWAISPDGKTWVQLTDFASTWQPADTDMVAVMPFQCSDTKNCSAGCQYSGANPYPYDGYACSEKGLPPPAIGLMRPAVGNAAGGLVPVAFGERVGLSAKYTWGGPLQLAMANITFANGVPSLVDYRENLTPTPSDPSGENLWSNPGGHTVIGTGYEPWGFSEDNSHLGFASDVFLSTSNPNVQQKLAPTSAAFTDVISWQWQGTPSLMDVTAYSSNYAYQPNGGPGIVSTYGHWEEPMVYSLGTNPAFIAFGSSADLNPPWNPANHAATFGLETWIVPVDGSKPAVQITHLNGGIGDRYLVYPTAYDPSDNSLFLTVSPMTGAKGAKKPGMVYRIKVPQI